jgi:uncharacterized protein (DUF433 family)
MDFSKFIQIDPDKKFGKPCVKGTKISVNDVLNWLASGMTKNDIMVDYPEQSMLAFRRRRIGNIQNMGKFDQRQQR